MKTIITLFLTALFLSLQAQQPDKRLYNVLKPLLDAHHGDAGVYVQHLKTGRTVAINADTVFPTASMIKIPILAGVFKRIGEGGLQYRQLLTYRDSLLYEGEDILGSFRDSQQITLDKVVMLMLTMSDNTASLWLQSLAGGGAVINEWLAQQGFEHTRVNSRTKGREGNRRIYGWGQTTPREMATLMKRIYKGEVVSKAGSERMYRNLTRNYWDTEGVLMIPPGIRTASKNGAVDESRSEVLMVNAPHGDYVYCIITKNNKDQGWNRDNEAWQLLRKVGAAIWHHYEPDSKWVPDPGMGQY
ncbi:serine hydrolase [Chitinophaga sp. Mgbs1]|uniref:beta-lactamase n=1 Tax=Chitinophaga solisilvae TaxID=1233460 RepID=A0A433WC53_9BACT|nr:serine hydrolase [Chitinophaga solisilvae]